MVTGLARTVLKCTLPGIPDIYQGTEFWDLSLVDPDNRRPVDYASRAAALEDGADPAALLRSWPDGRIKQQVIARLLADRAAAPQLYAEGGYEPLAAQGERSRNVIAFRRSRAGEDLIVVVPRLIAGVATGGGLPLGGEFWGDTALRAPAGARREILTGSEHRCGEGGLPLRELFSALAHCRLEDDRMRPAKAKRGHGGRAGLKPGFGTPHLQPVPAARRHDLGLARRAAAHRGDELRLGLRQPVPRNRRLGLPLRHPRPIPPRSAVPRRRCGRRRRPDSRLRGGRGLARPEGHGRPRHQSHGKRRAARRGAPGRLRSRRDRRHPRTLRGRSGRSLDRHGVGRPRGAELPRAFRQGIPARVLGRLRREAPGARHPGLSLRRRLQGAARRVASSDRPRQGARPRRALRRRDARLHLRRNRGDGRRGLRLPLQQLRLVGPARAMGARDLRGAACRRALDRLPRESRHAAHCAQRRGRSGAGRSAPQGALRARGVLLLRRADADRLRVGLSARAPRRRDLARAARGDRRRHLRLRRRRERDPGRASGRECRRCAVAALGAGRAVPRAAALRRRPPGGGGEARC